MLPIDLIFELENIINEGGSLPGETSKRMVDIRAKRFKAIRKKYPMGTAHVHGSGADIGKHGKAAFITTALQKKYEKERRHRTEVRPGEKSALTKALKHVQSKKPEKTGKVIPFRARKAA